jgi:hypothetical protein
MITRRLRDHFFAAYRFSPYKWAVRPVSRERTRALPICRRARFSRGVAGHRHDVVDLLALEVREQLGAGKAAVQPHPERGRRKGGAQLAQQAAQDPRGAAPGGRVAGPQHRGHRELLGLVVEGHRRHHGQVTPRVVVAVEERELLLAVGGVVRGIEIDGDPRRTPFEPAPLVLDHGVGQHVRHVAQGRPPDDVLEPRERRLRGQRRAGQRVALEQQLVDGVVGQPGGVVAVGVATGQAEHALANQLDRLMPDLAGLALVDQTAGQPSRQPQVGIDALEQDRPAIRTGVGGVEAGHDWLREPLALEGDLRYTGCGHRASSHLCIETPEHRFYSTIEGLGGSCVSSFANFPG